MKTSSQKESRTMTVAGIMSGTSADGIDVALVKIAAPRNSSSHLPRIQLLAHVAVPYPAAVRKYILQMMNANAASVADMSRLNWRLGNLYADAVKLALKKYPMRARSYRLPRPDDLSPGSGAEIPRGAGSMHVADGRSFHHRCRTWCSCGVGLSACGSGAGRPGRTAGAAVGLCGLSSSHAQSRLAEFGRHRQPDGDSRRRSS